MHDPYERPDTPAQTEPAKPRSVQRAGSAAPSDLEVAISQNLHICRKMRGSSIAHISAMGVFGESMMLEMERLLPDHVAQQNDQAQRPERE